MQIRYTGADASVELPISGACLTFPRGEWLDPEVLAEAAFVPAVHVAIAVRSLGADWQVRDAAPPAKPVKSTSAPKADVQSPKPAAPDQE